MKARQTNSRSKEQPSSAICPVVHPGAFAISSLKSRAAARAMLKRRPKPEMVFGLGDSPRPKFV
jgi:hypothetical protein